MPDIPADREELARLRDACVRFLDLWAVLSGEWMAITWEAVAAAMSGETGGPPAAILRRLADLKGWAEALAADNPWTPVAPYVAEPLTPEDLRNGMRPVRELLARLELALAPPVWFAASKADVLRALDQEPDYPGFLDNLVLQGRLGVRDATSPVGWNRYEFRFADPAEHAQVFRRLRGG